MQFSIGNFKGPLDLLLALIRKEEMDIVDIDLCKITHQYLEMIKTAPSLNLNDGGEFIRMAAALIFIKSRSLLPQVEEEFAEDEEMEPLFSKEDLIEALRQRDQFLKASEQLSQRLILGRDIWSCSGLQFESKEQEEIECGPLHILMITCKQVLKKAHTYRMQIVIPSIFEWLNRIRKYFIKGRSFSFSTLTQEKQESVLNQILLSFLSLLELGKLGFVSLSQKDQDIQIYTKKTVDDRVFQFLKNSKDTSFLPSYQEGDRA